MTIARLVFHLPAQHLDNWRDKQHFALFRRIADEFEPQGLSVLVQDRRARPFQGGETQAYDDGDLHILDTGRARGKGVLNASIAYLPPFWHLDPRGMQAESRIGGLDYNPRLVEQEPARAFFKEMRRKYPLARKSRRMQEDRITDLPRDGLAVFLQGSLPQENGLAFCSPEELLEAVVHGADGRPVLVKPHPLAILHDVEVIGRAIERGLPVIPTTANVNDIIAASLATVSYNSACALEGFLQRKPAILFGPSDFHHFAQTVRKPAEFPKALDQALSNAPRGYAKFLYWYFVHNSLNVTAQDFRQRVLAIFAEAGFSTDRLGLTVCDRTA